MYKGRLERWNDERGFGFIRPENEKSEVFIHISALKKMRRKPIIGDVIFYKIHTQSDGKKRAVNAKIEGVKEISTKVRRKTSATLKPKLFLFLILIFIVLFVYQRFSKEKELLVAKNIPTISTPKQQITFKCDGRQYCGQMKSRAEAVFFIKNCPYTKMDSDDDGIPCENDSRF